MTRSLHLVGEVATCTPRVIVQLESHRHDNNGPIRYRFLSVTVKFHCFQVWACLSTLSHFPPLCGVGLFVSSSEDCIGVARPNMTPPGSKMTTPGFRTSGGVWRLRGSLPRPPRGRSNEKTGNRRYTHLSLSPHLFLSLLELLVVKFHTCIHAFIIHHRSFQS